MIAFRCRCSHLFSVPEDQAGGTVQCPDCGLLNDVPQLGELSALDEDGTIRLGQTLTAPEPRRLTELDRTFAPRRVDEQGREIDLRTTFEQVKRAGAPAGRPKRANPRYDPETGELITPLEVAQPSVPVPPEGVPLGKPVLAYATLAAEPALTAPRILLELFMPANIAVILIVFAAYVVVRLIAFFLLILLAAGGPIVAAFSTIPQWAVLFLVAAHYGNAIDETGRAGKDQLPRPLRDLNWQDDIWGMFARVAFGAFLCYWPTIVVGSLPAGRPGEAEWGWLALGAGTFFLPAVWLTLISSGSILNLRPDRVAVTVWRCGPGYLLLPAVLVIAAIAQGWAGLGLDVLPGIVNSVISKYVAPHPQFILAATLGSLMIGVYAAHFFCWYLGTLFRRHEDNFPWVWQEYERKRR
jgi:hypothetical protein